MILWQPRVRGLTRTLSYKRPLHLLSQKLPETLYSILPETKTFTNKLLDSFGVRNNSHQHVCEVLRHPATISKPVLLLEHAIILL